MYLATAMWSFMHNAVSGGLILLAAAGCSRPDETKTVLRVWSHQGQEQENVAMRAMADAFNEAHADQGWYVDIAFFPDYQYTEKLSIAAAAGDLPDAFDLDGPTVAQFVDAGLLAPLTPYIDEQARADFLPTIIEQGTIDGTLYALGAYDSALVLYYDKALLNAAGVQVPPKGQAWSWEAFMAACRRLKASGVEPVSLHMDVTADEWYTYAFSPLLWSAGGALIDSEQGRVEGVLNAPANRRALRKWQRLFTEGYAARSPINPDPFGAGETAMDWNGHWMVRSHIDKKGERLGAMPLPRMGDESVAACGSWCWGIYVHSANREMAARWVQWVTSTKKGIIPMVRAGGAVPARESAFSHFPEYETDPHWLFAELLRESGRPRPKTPFYPNLTQHFAAALRDIASGADVDARLDQAAQAVQRIIERRRGSLP